MVIVTLTIFLAKTAKKISVTLHVLILYLLELSGNSTDVKNVRQIVMEARKKKNVHKKIYQFKIQLLAILAS